MTNSTARRAGAGSPRPVILVVSFGTSYNGNRHVTIGAVENAIAERFWPEFEVRRAFTAQTIIDKLARRDGIRIDNVAQALDHLVADGVGTVVVQPTHLIAGIEYAALADTLGTYRDKFSDVVLGRPLLSDDQDYRAVIDALRAAMGPYDDGRTALCLMGHGTGAESNAAYSTLQDKLDRAGLDRYFVATVEATPAFDDVVAAVRAAGFQKAVLRPLMVVAGDHANNDMADTSNPYSFASKLAAAGVEATCVVEGLGQLDGIAQIYVSHAADSVGRLGSRQADE